MDPSPLGWKELDSSLSTRVEEWLVKAGRFVQLGPAFVALTFSVLCMLASEWASAHHVFQYVSTIRPRDAGPPDSPFSVRLSIESATNNTIADVLFPSFESLAVRNWDGRMPVGEEAEAYTKFPEVHAFQGRLDDKSPVRRRYADLARLYLKPFAKISRNMYMDYLDGVTPGSLESCSGCFLIQVKNKELYVYDPKQVRTMAQFRGIRMREAIHWATRAVEADVIDNTEFVVSTTDGIVSTSHNHSYRMPEPDPVLRPIFTLTHCNCSANIPFPMVFTDLLRRGFKEEFWNARSGSIARWDQMATQVLGAQRHESHVWARKKRAAVFRGAIRVPSGVKHKPDYHRNCHKHGRTALAARAEWHLKNVAQRRAAWRRKHWLWAVLGRVSSTRISRLFLDTAAAAGQQLQQGNGTAYERGLELERQRSGASFEPLLDVQLTGACGGRTYKSDNLSMEQQSSYRYTVHAEGNGFWADRLAIQLFGSSAVIKQLTPCGMFFEPLLRAYRHFIPVDYAFRDVVRQAEWARDNDAQARRVVREARRFAGDYLTVSGISAYADEVLREYTRLLGKDARDIRIHPHAIKLYPTNG